MKKWTRLLAGAVSLTALLLASALVFGAQSEAPDEPMALQGVMQKLSTDMQTVVGAIAVENWEAVAQLAPSIAQHEEPPMDEKKRIMAWLGDDAAEFRSFDGHVHKAATTMGEAAARGDGEAVIAAFADVQWGCLGCHQNYRERFVEHFHGRQ